MSQPVYVLGHSHAELERLMEQGRFYGELTEDIFRRAGLVPGMRVLDVGSGAGDVSFVAASIVGPEGRVLGIDKSEQAVALARQRAAQAGLSHVNFQVADLETFHSSTPFDAVVGRLVLIYVRDPRAVLRTLASCVRPGGLLAFVELEVSMARSVPSLTLFSKTVGWLRETFVRSGVEVDMGTRLYGAFRGAGLPSPSMLMLGHVEGGESTRTYDNLVQTIRTLSPAMERFGIASAAEVDIESLAARLHSEAVAAEAVVMAPPAIGAWTRVP
jgi:2-polyprenyl-3-methyl-5-hydroxy-6-metoxy-1,4-benzoquinol methylase